MLRPQSNFKGIDISEIRKMNALAGPSTINLGIGQLPNDLPESVKNKGIEAFSSGETRYTSNQGSLDLRVLIAEYHSKKSGVSFTSDQVVVTNGAEGALWNILYTYLEPGDEVLIPEIAFSVYDTITKLQGAKPLRYKLNSDFSIDFAYLEGLITNRTKFLVINSPNNPTGSLLSREDIKKICLLADKMDFYIISDEIYSELYFDDLRSTTPLEFSTRVIVVDGISKMAAATGLRIGWTISSAEITKPMVIANQYISTCASSVSQYAAIKALDGSCNEFLKNTRKDLQFKRDYAYSTLSEIPNISVEKPKGAFYIFPNISWFGCSGNVAYKILRECDVLTIPGLAFGERGDDYIRISYAVDFDNLKEALSRIKRVLSDWRK